MGMDLTIYAEKNDIRFEIISYQRIWSGANKYRDYLRGVSISESPLSEEKIRELLSKSWEYLKLYNDDEYTDNMFFGEWPKIFILPYLFNDGFKIMLCIC